jgi:hypothetical protein
MQGHVRAASALNDQSEQRTNGEIGEEEEHVADRRAIIWLRQRLEAAFFIINSFPLKRPREA